MSGMLITSRHHPGRPGAGRGARELKYGDNKSYGLRGHVNVATVIYGEPDAELRDLVEHLLARWRLLRGRHRDWTGDSRLDGIDKMVGRC